MGENCEAELDEMRRERDEARTALGQVIVAASLRPGETMLRITDDAALDAVLALVCDRDRLHTMNEAAADSLEKSEAGAASLRMAMFTSRIHSSPRLAAEAIARGLDATDAGGRLLVELADLRAHKAEHCQAVDRADAARNELAEQLATLRVQLETTTEAFSEALQKYAEVKERHAALLTAARNVPIVRCRRFTHHESFAGYECIGCGTRAGITKEGQEVDEPCREGCWVIALEAAMSIGAE